MLNKDEEDEKRKKAGGFMLPTYEELALIEQQAKEDAAMAASSEKNAEKKLEFLKKPSNWDDGYQFGDVTKTWLATARDISIGTNKGILKLGEGIGDAAQYGVAALADLFGADDKAEAIRQNAQKEKVAAAFSGVDDYLDKYSVLGRTGDAAAESLGQISAIVATGGIAGAAGLGTAGATALTSSVMGLSSFGSGTSEAYAAGAEEGEAEAYGAIAGAADALSEMIFAGLGKGFKAIGLSKGLSSADDMLAKALSSKIRNTLAKNAVQLGVKAGAEGLEEVIAGTMQAAGKKMTYMSEQDFADIIKDENLLEQFVVGAFASGVAQAPSMVRATRAGVDLVSDDGADVAETGTEGTGEAKRIWDDNNTEHIEIERTGRESGAADDDIRMAGELSDILGKKIRFYREEAKGGTIRNGEYHEDTDTIYINAASKNVKSQIVAHELTHSIERAGAYKSLVDTVFEKLRADGEDIDALYRKKEMLYARADAKLGSYEEITSEIVAEFVEKRLLTDEASIKSLVSENRTLGQRIREWFDSLLAKMGNASAKEREYIRQMRDMYARALGENVYEASVSDGSVRHHISKHFGREIDIALNPNINGTNQVKAREYTPKILVDNGVKNLPMLISKNHVRTTILTEDEAKAKGMATGKGINYHGLGKKLLMKTIDNLDKPTEIYKKSDDTYLIVTRFKDQSGNDIIVPVRIDGTGVYNNVYIDENHILSAYGKKNLKDYIDRNNFELIYKKSDTTLNKGVQYSNVGDTADNSISQNVGNVNRKIAISDLDGEPIEAERSHGRKYSVSEVTEKEYEDAVENGDTATAQKLVDEAARDAGYTVKAYHGSHERFNEFSHEDAGGLFNFTESRENAKTYALGGGGNRQRVYEQLVAVDQDNGLVWEYDPDEDVYEAIGREDDATGEIMPLPDTASRRVLPRDQVEGNRADDFGNGTYVFRSKNANVGTYYLDVGKALDLVSNKAEAEAVFREIYDAFKTSADSFTDTRRVEIEGALRRILWSARNGFDNFWSETKGEYALRAFEDYIVPELKKRGYNSIYHQDDSHKTYAVFDANQIKSADPVTYDDNGNVIPLSKRFDAREADIRYSVSEADEAEQTVQQIRNDIAADEARYRELSDIVMSNERFNVMMPDEQNAILDEMQSLRKRIDNAYLIVQDMSYEGDAGEDAPVPSDEDAPVQKESGSKADGGDGYAFTIPEEFGDARMTFSEAAVEATPNRHDYEYVPKTKGSKVANEFTREEAVERRDAREKKRADRKAVAKAETAIKRLGYDIAGTIVDNYEEAAGIIEDDRLAAQVESDIERYIDENNVSPRIDMAAKLIAQRASEPGELGLSGHDLEVAAELATLYAQSKEISQNNVRAHGRAVTRIVNDELDNIFAGYDWFSEKGKKAKRFASQLQLNLSNPEQVMRDAFGEATTVTDGDGETKTVDVAEELNAYIIRPTIENSARARRQTNKMVANLRGYNLTESESAMTQIFSEYSELEEAGSRKAAMTESDLRDVLAGKLNDRQIDSLAEKIARKEYKGQETKEKKEFRESIAEQFKNVAATNRKRAAERALRIHKEEGGTNLSWNALSKEARNAKIEAVLESVSAESVDRVVEATKELRLLLDDMFDAINAVSVIHGAKPIPFRRGYMPHSHRQTAEVQKWFNDHMGGINVTPVGDLPTDIAGKTADRKPNKRWMAHAQERTGPRTTWDALGNVEDYLRIANDTIYHIDDIRKMRVLERYIRGIYSVARGATGEETKTKVRNDIMQRLHGELDDDQLVFLGLKKKETPVVSDEDMDLSQMTPFVTWLTNYANDLAAKQIFNRDIEAIAGRKYNNLANTITSWSSRVMMQYNISSNLKQLSQLGTVAGDVGMSITKDAAALTARSMRELGNGTNDLEQKYHISERSTFLAEKQDIEEATFASDHDLTEAQRAKRDKAAEIWDYAWSFTDTTMSRFAVYSYFLEGMQRGMNDTDALAYADSKARNILASRMKGSSPLIFQSKNPILRLFTMFQREPLAAWEDVLKTMPREYADYKEANGEKAAKEWIAKRVTGRILGASMTNAAYLALGLGTPAMFDILGVPLSAILEKVIGDLTEDEEDDQTWGEMLKGFGNNLKNEIADDIPFASLIAAITNTAAGTDFESRLPINAPDLDKLFAMFTAPADVAKLTMEIANVEDAETIEALREDRADAAKQIPFAMLSSILEIIGTAAPAGNQIRKSVSGLIAVLRGGEYTSDGRLKYEVGGLDAVRAVALGKSNTKAAQEWVEEGFGSYSEAETDAYHALVSSGVGKSKAAKYVNAVTDAEKQGDETKAQAEARILDGLQGLKDDQRAELYYELVATDNQIEAIDAAIKAGADKTSAVEAARSIRELSKRGDKVEALIASDMGLKAKRVVYDLMVTDEDGDKIDALEAVGLDFEDFLAAKAKQSSLNADDSIKASQRATRFMAWIAQQGYTNEQEETVSDTFAFASGFKVQAKAYEDLVAAGVAAENAVTVTDALSGTSRAIDKINAIWSTGLTGEQLDTAIKAVVTEGWYEKYRTVIDANVPLDVLTWVLDNADQNGNDSIDNEERTLILSQLALSRKELSALWIATGGSEKSNPWGSGGSSSSKVSVKTPTVKTPTVKTPSVKTPSVSTPQIDINVPYFGYDLEE